eukprot:8082839-Alexandrium_andersonii.AAC.1
MHAWIGAWSAEARACACTRARAHPPAKLWVFSGTAQSKFQTPEAMLHVPTCVGSGNQTVTEPTAQ